jgi:hypothetical protein
MTLGRYLFSLAVVLSLTGGLMYIMPPPLRIAWGIGWLVTLELSRLLDTKQGLEPRPILRRLEMVGLILLTWPLRLILCVLTFYGMWMQPRWDAQYERERPERERRQQERIARMTATDAARTNRRCAACGKPVPSYRKTCRHCHEPFAAPTDGDLDEAPTAT